MSSRQLGAGRFALVLCAGLASAGCHNDSLVSGPLPPGTSISFDGGATELLDVPPLLPGNILALDGGVGNAAVKYGQLELVVKDHDTRRPMPARVIFRPPPGAGFADSLTMGQVDV